MTIELWFFPSIFALIVWGVAAFTPKLAVSSLSPAQIIIYQAFGFALFTLLILVQQKFSVEFDLRGTTFSVAAGIMGMSGWLFYLRALKSGPVSIVSILAALYPALTMLLAFIILREKVSVPQGIGLALSMAALLILVVQKNGHAKASGAGWVLPSLTAMVFWAAWAFLPKMALETLPMASVLICETLGNGIVAFGLYAREGFKLPRSRDGLKFATLPSFISMGAATCYVYALGHGPVSIIAVLTALYPVVTVLLARVILKEKMTPLQIAACFIAFGAIGLMVM